MQSTGHVYSRPESKFLWIKITGPDGRSIRRSSKTTDPKQAEACLKEELRKLTSLSFREAVVDFFQVKDIKPKTRSNYQTSLRAVDPLLGDLSLFEINREVLKDLVRHRRKTVSDTSVRRDLAFVSSVFSHAMETMLEAPESNPVINFSKKHLKENPRVRWLKPKEYERLLDACTNETQRILIELACHTGLRHGEIVSLRKRMLDFSRQEITLPRAMTKSNKERVVPLCDSLCQKLEVLCSNTPGDLVFCHLDPKTHEWKPYESFRNSWYGIRSRANLKDVRFHDLRHTFASWWVQSGGNTMFLQAILGHSSPTMVQRYAHLSTGAYHDEVRRIFKHSSNTE